MRHTLPAAQIALPLLAPEGPGAGLRLTPKAPLVRYWKHGWRVGIVTHEGRKWARVLLTGTLDVETRLAHELPSYVKPLPDAITDHPHDVARRLRAKAKAAGKSNPDIRKALALLEQEL